MHHIIEKQIEKKIYIYITLITPDKAREKSIQPHTICNENQNVNTYIARYKIKSLVALFQNAWNPQIFRAVCSHDVQSSVPRLPL